jgi:hypothetical protein
MIKLSSDSIAVPVPDITRLYVAKQFGSEEIRQVQRALMVQALPESWKEYFREKLNRLSA